MKSPVGDGSKTRIILNTEETLGEVRKGREMLRVLEKEIRGLLILGSVFCVDSGYPSVLCHDDRIHENILSILFIHV